MTMSWSTGLRPLMMVGRILPGHFSSDLSQMPNSIFCTQILHRGAWQNSRRRLVPSRRGRTWRKKGDILQNAKQIQSELFYQTFIIDENRASGAQTQIQIPCESCEQDWKIGPLRNAGWWHPHQGSLGWVKTEQSIILNPSASAII